MKLAEYKSSLTEIRQRTLCFLFRDGKVLLGLKKTGFGKGNWLGIGGKVEPGEGIEEAAIREAQEEICVTPMNLKRVGLLNFLFPLADDPNRWNQQVFVFVTDQWQGEIAETSEIKPEWFSSSEIPYHSMWDDATYWLPGILAGKGIEADFLFGEDLKVREYRVELEA